MGVLEVGPYSPRFLAAVDFRGCFTHGNGENVAGLGAEEAKVGVDGDEGRFDLDEEEDDREAGVEGQGVR